jgi:hypothetical protein
MDIVEHHNDLFSQKKYNYTHVNIVWEVRMKYKMLFEHGNELFLILSTVGLCSVTSQLSRRYF